MDIYEETFFEAKQLGLIYHFTKVPQLICILKEDSMIAKKEFEKNFISFTRNPRFNTETYEGRYKTVRMSFDGEKMSENYKIKPFNYWFNMGRAKNAQQYRDGELHTRDGNGEAESEERLELKVARLRGIKKYIVAVEVLEEAIYLDLRGASDVAWEALNYIFDDLPPRDDFKHDDEAAAKWTYYIDDKYSTGELMSEVTKFLRSNFNNVRIL